MTCPIIKCFKSREPAYRSSSMFIPHFLSCFFFSFTLLSSSSSAFVFSGNETEDIENRSDLFPKILRDEAVGRLYELGKVSDASGYLERTFMSPASMRAINLIQSWMEDAGLRTWVDEMGNVHGRAEGANAAAEALLIGSHMDTVVDAGMFDGTLGIISALSALKALHVTGKLGQLRRPVEVIAFSDEEGVRFQTTFLGSGAIAGILPATALKTTDKRGLAMEDVLKENSLEITEESLSKLKYDPASVWGYVEVHIEQGPVLERVGYPLGVVKGIAGQTRLKVTVRGSQGHAGTVPMSMRQDPMAAAAELILTLESLLGEISTWPSASNVIPGQVTYTVDIRAMDDTGREAVIYELSRRMYQICDKRSVSCNIERKHDAGAVACDSELSSQLKSAAYSALKRMEGDIQGEVPVLMSGAGHDAMAMSHLTKVGMIFVRCRGGISHSPEEHVLDNDVWAASLAIMSFLETLQL
ncbi:hypothetical protein K1719_006375 [Acacia pycnantha]|nr:hypothetical protein K1719_006375 [Acacia pycnantha]